MHYTYILRIGGATRQHVADVLEVPSSQDEGDWSFELRESPNDPPTRFVDIFLGLLADKFGALEEIGVSRDNIAVWLLYEYDGQCNIEFQPDDLRMLGEAGITLCISCWETAEEEVPRAATSLKR
jgi:hypothetical protein